MSDDNIWLAAGAGFAQGLSSTIVPFMQDKYRSRLAMEQAAKERELRKVALPPELAGRLGLPSLPTDPEVVNSATTLAGKQIMKNGKIYKMNKVTGELQEVGESSPGSGDVIKEFGVDTSSDYISGADILLGRPDLKGSIDPSQRYNKSMLPYLKPGAAADKTKQIDKDATWAISEIGRILPLNEKSSGGFLGGIRQKGMSMANLEDEKFRNTADVVNSARSLVARVLKSTFGGQLSDSEREYLNSVYGAMPNYSVAERRIALTNVQRMLQNKSGNVEDNQETGLGTPSLGGSEEVKRQTKDGKIAIFDSRTKKFLRFE